MTLHIVARQQYYEARSKVIKGLRETQNPNPYPHKFNVTIGVPAFNEKYEAEIKEKDTRLDGTTVRLLA